MKPDEVIGLLADYQARLIPPILANGGTSEKFLGDGMMAAFGAVVRREGYAADALRAAEGILESVDAWNRDQMASGRPRLDIRVAVTAGLVAAGAVGGETRLEYAVVGHPVNLAAKLEKHAKVEHARVLCTRDALERALDQGFVPTMPPPGLCGAVRRRCDRAARPRGSRLGTAMKSALESGYRPERGATRVVP